MKVIYVAGKYSAPNEYEVKKNIAAAEEVALKIWKAGHVAICPHLNTAHWGNILTHEQFIKGDLEIVKRCDAIYMIPGWQHSKGAIQEHSFALQNRIRVIYNEYLDDYLKTASAINDWQDQAADESGTVLANVPLKTKQKTEEKYIGHGTYITKDSGARTEFSTGAKRDTNEGKGRFDLVSPVGLKRLAQLYERGAIKYGPRNWEKGIPLFRYLDSAERHLNMFKSGCREEDHLAAVAWNAFGYMHTEEMLKQGKLPASLAEEAK